MVRRALDSPWLPGLLVAGLAFLAHAASLANGFAWDDKLVILGNPALRGGAAELLLGIDRARVTEVTPFYRPLTLLTFLLEERLHGLSPLPMHLVNVALHAAAAALVHRLAAAVSGDRAVALVAGLLFAVHPLGAEPVAFLSGGRNTLLACLLALAAWHLHRGAVAEGRRRLAVAGAVLFLGALLAKETALPILAFIVAAEWAGPSQDGPGARGRALLRLLPYGLATGLYLLLRQRALSGAGARVELLDGLGGRLADLVYIVPRALLTIAWPPASSPRYFVPDRLGPMAPQLLLAWVAILAAAFWLLGRGRSRTTLFGLAWLAAFWLPVSGLVPFPGVALADRYLYAPAVGIWLVLADQLVRLVRHHLLALPRWRSFSAAAGGAALATSIGATWSLSLAWRSDLTLAARVVEQYPGEAFGHHNLGTAYLDQAGDLDRAEAEFERALAIDPAFPRLRTQLGYVRLRRGDHAGALVHYRFALALDPADAEALFNAALASERLGDWPAALALYRRFLEVPPGELALARPEAEEKVRLLPLLMKGR